VASHRLVRLWGVCARSARTATNPHAGFCLASRSGSSGAPEWSQMLELFSDANLYQTWSYARIHWGEKNLSHLVLKRGGEVLGMAQVRIVRPTRFKFGMAYLRWGPLYERRGRPLDPEAATNMAAPSMRSMSAREGSSSMFCQTHLPVRRALPSCSPPSAASLGKLSFQPIRIGLSSWTSPRRWRNCAADSTRNGETNSRAPSRTDLRLLKQAERRIPNFQSDLQRDAKTENI